MQDIMQRRQVLGGLLISGALFAADTRKAHLSEMMASGTGMSPQFVLAPNSDVTDELVAAARVRGKLFLPKGRSFYTADGVVTNFPLDLSGSGRLEVIAPGKSVLYFTGRNAQIEGIRIEGITFAEPHYRKLGVGLNDDHSCLRLGGVRGAVLRDLTFEGGPGGGPDICFHVGFGGSTMPDRGSIGVLASNIRGRGVRAMGLEMFGSRHGQFTNLDFTGTDGNGGVAIMHGVRINAFGFAPNIGNRVQAKASGFHTGCSLQRFSQGNEVVVEAENCDIGAHVHGSEEGRDAENVCRENWLRLKAINCKVGVYDGGAYNQFDVQLEGCRDSGILSRSARGVVGVSIANQYTGTISGFARYGADILSNRCQISLDIIGDGPWKSDVGLRVLGDHLCGQVSVSNVQIGIRLAGNGADLKAVVKNTGLALQITGDANTVQCDIEGDVHIHGSGNRLRGRVRGRVIDNGLLTVNELQA